MSRNSHLIDSPPLGAAVPRVDARDRAAPILALSIEQACEALGVSWKTWREHIEPSVRVVRVGRCKRVSVAELQRWLDENGDMAGDC